MISEYILTVLILNFFLSLLLWNGVDCVTGALQGERYVQWFDRSFGDSRFSVTLVSGVTLYILSSSLEFGRGCSHSKVRFTRLKLRIVPL